MAVEKNHLVLVEKQAINLTTINLLNENNLTADLQLTELIIQMATMMKLLYYLPVLFSDATHRSR